MLAPPHGSVDRLLFQPQPTTDVVVVVHRLVVAFTVGAPPKKSPRSTGGGGTCVVACGDDPMLCCEQQNPGALSAGYASHESGIMALVYAAPTAGRCDPGMLWALWALDRGCRAGRTGAAAAGGGHTGG